MFKIGEEIVCVDLSAHQYYTRWGKDTKNSEPKSITLNKKYIIIKCEDNKVFIKNDNDIVKSYRKDRFKSITQSRKAKLDKICLKLGKK
jgi:hypothetical protein